MNICLKTLTQVTKAGIITTVAGSLNNGGFGASGPATAASMYQPNALGMSSAGDFFISDAFHTVRKVVERISYENFLIILHAFAQVTTMGVMTLVAGTPGQYGYSGDGSQATSALLKGPYRVLTTTIGDIYIADTQNNVIRKVTHCYFFIFYPTTFSHLSSQQLYLIVRSHLLELFRQFLDQEILSGTGGPPVLQC